jgi:Zn-dependent M28 family amino/carboxypeptidase
VDPLAAPLGDGSAPLPIMRVSIAAANRLLAAAGVDRSLAQLESADGAGPAGSFVTDLHIEGRCEFTSARGRNVAAVIAAAEPDADRYLLISAHYDHIGASGLAARDAGPGVRPGANDNASGVASLLLLAEAIAAEPLRRHHTLLVAFDGEELGFLGAQHFVDHPPVALDAIDAAINLDMTGQVRGDTIYVMGDIPPAGWLEVSRRAAAPPIELRMRSTGRLFAGSDHVPLNRRGVPAITLCTGPDDRYHTRDDSAESVDPAEGVRVTRLAMLLWRRFDRLDAPIDTGAPLAPPGPVENP